MRFRGLIAASLLLVSAPVLAEEPDLSGLWRFDMTTPGGVTTLGAMTVRKNKDSSAYEGRVITNGGVEGLPIRSIQIQSRQMTMQVDSPRGLIVFRGDVGPSGQSFSGTLRYHDGRDFSMAGVRQQALFPSPPTKAKP